MLQIAKILGIFLGGTLGMVVVLIGFEFAVEWFWKKIWK